MREHIFPAPNRNIGAFCLITALAGATAVSGCARKPTPLEQRVASEVAQETPVAPGAPMEEASKEILFEAESLTPRQRQRLEALHAKSMAEAKTLNEELSKNRIVLLKSLVNPAAKNAEIEVLKDRIVSLERKKTRQFLDSLDQANRILGRRSFDDEKVYRAFLHDPVHDTNTVMPE